MTFKERYAADMGQIVPSEDFERQLLHTLPRQNLRPAPISRGWRTAAITLAAACFVLLLGIGTFSAVAFGGAKSSAPMNAYSLTAERNGQNETATDLYATCDMDEIPEESTSSSAMMAGSSDDAAYVADAESPRVGGGEHNDVPVEGAWEEGESDSAPDSVNTKSWDADGLNTAPVWLEGFYAETGNDLLALYADRSEVRGVTCLASGSILPGHLTDAFADALYAAQVCCREDGGYHEPVSDQHFRLDGEICAAALLLSDGTSLRLSLQDGCVTLGDLPFLLRLSDPAVFDSVLSALTDHAD